MKLSFALLPLFARAIVWWLVVLTFLLVCDAGADGTVRALAPCVLAALGGSFGLVARVALSRRDVEYLRALPLGRTAGALPAWTLGFALVLCMSAVFVVSLGSSAHALLLGLVGAWSRKYGVNYLEPSPVVRLMMLAQLGVAAGAYWCVIASQTRERTSFLALKRHGWWIAPMGTALVLFSGVFAIACISFVPGELVETALLAWFVVPSLTATVVAYACYRSARRQLAASGSDALPDTGVEEYDAR
jgi:hypothetical protein